jgi:hypothetical protein
MLTITSKLISVLTKIRDSLLAPWQKLDAIHTFVQPGLTYALRSCPVTKDALRDYRSKLVEVIKSICHLPKRASSSYFFADRADGGLGFQDPMDERHVQTISKNPVGYRSISPQHQYWPTPISCPPMHQR